MLRVAHLADRCIAFLVDPANFARGQPDLRITFVARHQRRRAARRTHHLPAVTRRQFDVVNRQTDWNRLERQRIANLRRSRRPARNGSADLDARRRDDVTLFAVLVLQQRQPRRTHRIIFDRRHRRLHTVLVALEIHEADFLLVPAANAARGHATVRIAATGLLPRDDQRLLRRRLRNIAEVRDGNISRGRR